MRLEPDMVVDGCTYRVHHSKGTWVALDVDHVVVATATTRCRLVLEVRRSPFHDRTSQEQAS